MGTQREGGPGRWGGERVGGIWAEGTGCLAWVFWTLLLGASGEGREHDEVKLGKKSSVISPYKCYSLTFQSTPFHA